MRYAAILLATLAAGACASPPPSYVVRYDLDHLAFETSLRDASPGFAELPRSSAPESEAPPPA